MTKGRIYFPDARFPSIPLISKSVVMIIITIIIFTFRVINTTKNGYKTSRQICEDGHLNSQLFYGTIKESHM